MRLTTVPIDSAIGHILRHNLSDPQGHKSLPKGRRLRAEDVGLMRELGIEQVRVAILEPGDVHEDEAAKRLAMAVCGAGLTVGAASHSRVNLLAIQDSIVEVHIEALLQMNEIEGLTVATRMAHSLVRTRQRVATIKIIPFAVRETDIVRAEAIAHDSGAVIWLRPLRMARVGVLLVSSAAAQARIEQAILPAITGRVQQLGSQVIVVRSVLPDETEIAEGIAQLAASNLDLLITAGETSIMDRDDVTPLGIRQAGGRIEHYGAPVEPGNLLLLAYIGNLPILGAPGCVRSRDVNIVDLLLPRILAGEIIRARDIIMLGHGGLLGV